MKYFFQNYLTLEIESNGKRQFDDYFDNEYARINETNESDSSPSYTVRLEIVDELPDNLPSDAIVRSVRCKKLFSFKYAITGAGTDNAVVYFQDHPVRRIYVTAVGVFIQAQVLEPVMYLSFLKQDIFFMHSAGVSKDGMAYVFPAYGGTGKTTTSMSLMTQGYDFLGDDLLIIDSAKKLVFPYPRPLHIFAYNVRNLQGARIPVSIVFIIYFKNVARFFLERILRTDFLISTRIHADEILPDLRLSKSVALHNVVFLKKAGASETIELSTEDLIAEHAKNIVLSADLNESLFSILEDEARAKRIQELEVSVASSMLRAANYFGYLNTRSIDMRELEKYVNNVEA